MRPTRTDLVENRDRAVERLRHRAHELRSAKVAFEALAEAVERIPPIRDPGMFVQCREVLIREAESRGLRAFELALKAEAAADMLERSDP